ncbi:MAG TPA: hypothetical protein P5572_15440 [Phycisphaerae bacterium]|nr:hypothetical protein [Phycisphaerae bacterium]
MMVLAWTAPGTTAEHHQDQEQHREADRCLDHAREQDIDHAAEIASRCPDRHPDDACEQHGPEPHAHRDGGAVHEAGSHVTAAVVGSEPMLRGGRREGFVRDLSRVIRDRRPERERGWVELGAGLEAGIAKGNRAAEAAADQREIAAGGCYGREMPGAVVAADDRLIPRDKRCAHREQQQDGDGRQAQGGAASRVRIGAVGGLHRHLARGSMTA